jgi:hypothetical protein
MLVFSEAEHVELPVQLAVPLAEVDVYPVVLHDRAA